MLPYFEYINNQESRKGTTCFCLQFGHFQLLLKSCATANAGDKRLKRGKI